MTIKVIRPGLLTSVQDLGRYGMQKDGVIVGGAMDLFAFRLANILVGNQEEKAALEIMMLGPQLEFLENTLIAICGGQLSPSVDGQPIPEWRPVLIKKGGILSFGAMKTGCRAYIAITGGIDVPEVMGSRSTYLRAEMGGFQGRSLQEGDVLLTGSPSKWAIRTLHRLVGNSGSSLVAASKWTISQSVMPIYRNNPVIRVIRGGEFQWFSAKSREQFFKTDFWVTPQSDRMGYRLNGSELKLSEQNELISTAVTAGTVQVPADGNPIVLMADRQTTGGYPKIAQVATIDLPILAQVKPGEIVRFHEIQLEEAQELLRVREWGIQLLKQGVQLKD
ncbi:5-oxoprolinase subunit C family protein [Neobacillus jeddahensis]|uniref:5-oxoprolinase subunit C family protein n=1 Tax=Neobacillus jeddahensis TaxID=1461580 RepID=UPI00058C310E|nr:biotin-dependent carboxyltransferase family protein [Neobacillus jeddahensis]